MVHLRMVIEECMEDLKMLLNYVSIKAKMKFKVKY